MNNGSLVDNILTTTSARAADKKTNWPKHTTSLTDGFQSTLDQLRPKVAARKAEPNTSSTESRIRDGQSRSVQPQSDNSSPKKVAGNTGRSVGSVESGAETSKAQTATSQHKVLQKPTEVDEVDDEPLATQVISGAPQVEQPLGTTQTSLLSGVLADVTGTNEQTTVEEEIVGDLLLDLSATQQVVNPVVDDALESVLNPASSDNVILPSALASQIVNVLGNKIGEGVTPLAAAANNGASNGLLSLDEAKANGLGITSENVGESLLLDGDGEISDNPDLLLLNAKTIMNKLAEANAGLQNQSSESDVPDALATVSPLGPLGRLGEAQAPATRGFVVQTGVSVGLGQPQWGQAVGERVLWLAAQNVSTAEIRLDPPELGPMQVRVSVHQDQVNVSFTSPHPAVRDVLDQQLNRLREMFSEQGLNLVDVDVSDKSFAQQDQERDEPNKNPALSLEDEELAPLTSSILISNRLVDHYA